MKNTIRFIVSMVIVTMLFCLSSCAKGEPFEVDVEGFLEEQEGKDNSKDRYYKAFSKELEPFSDYENDFSLYTVKIGNDKVFLSGIFTGDENPEYRSDVICTLKNGNSRHYSFANDKENKINSGFYPIPFSENFFSMVFNRVENTGKYSYILYNEAGEIIKEVYLDEVSLDVSGSWIVSMDKDNKLHIAKLVVDSNGIIDSFYYVIVSKEGEVLCSDLYADVLFSGFSTTADGKVVCCYGKSKAISDEPGRRTFLTYIDTEDEGGSYTLEFYNDQRRIEAYTVIEPGKTVYSDKDGIWFADEKLENGELIYRWANHGMSVGNMNSSISVSDICADSEDNISFLTYDSVENNYTYNVLKPTDAVGDVVSLEFAVAKQNKDLYTKAVSEFNKKYPGCELKLVDSYDETVLLTKLIAGDGPVLVDTSLTGFCGQKNLWMRLDEAYKQIGIYDKLNMDAVKLCTIEDGIYGMSLDFKIETLITSSDIKEWSYDDFLECLREKSCNQLFCDSNTEDYVSVIEFFGTDTEDTYFLDNEGQPIFRTDSFNDLLDLLDFYKITFASGDLENFMSDCLCKRVVLRKPEQVWVYMKKCGEDYDFTGYPSKVHSNNRMIPGNIVSVRESASTEEKEAAVAFLNLLLSYDCQKTMVKDINFSFSVRNDVLEEQIEAVKKNSIAVMDDLTGDTIIREETDTGKIREKLSGLMADSVPKPDERNAFRDILYEEFSEYFAGRISREMLADRLESRISLLLLEKGP